MNLLDLAPAEASVVMSRWISKRGEPAYRVQQIMPRLWRRPVARWWEATELPETLRLALEAEFPLPRPTLEVKQVSTDGTEKFLWRFERDGAVESVVIPEGKRRTLCISSQAGCALGCVFCATGLMGFIRHLAPWEVAAQVRELLLDTGGKPPTNVVFMGMGEPLHNWAAVDTALSILNDRRGLGIGARHITVSTVGIIPGLERLAERPEQFRVALSLHAAISARRRRLMPVEKKYPLNAVLKTLQRFHGRVTFEYVMILGKNDSDTDAGSLATIARPLGALVNLLPLHPGGSPGLQPTSPDAMRRFARRLRHQGVKVTIRRSRGLDISAACGQLRTDVQRRSGLSAEHHTHIEQ